MNAAIHAQCTFIMRLQRYVFCFLHAKCLVKYTHPPYFCGGDRAEVVCPGWACQPIRPDIASNARSYKGSFVENLIAFLHRPKHLFSSTTRQTARKINV